MRATAIKTNRLRTSRIYFPGSHVDVLVTLRPENNARVETHTVSEVSAVHRTKMDPIRMEAGERRLVTLL